MQGPRPVPGGGAQLGVAELQRGIVQLHAPAVLGIESTKLALCCYYVTFRNTVISHIY
jgi:hypothetical protein